MASRLASMWVGALASYNALASYEGWYSGTLAIRLGTLLTTSTNPVQGPPTGTLREHVCFRSILQL